MPKPRAALLFMAFAGLLLVACGGGGEGPAAKGQRITDPAKVPSSTPVQNPTLYQITGDEVILSGGQSAKITPTSSTPTSSQNYVVKSGDLCGTIATQFGISVDDLQKANRSMECSALHIGDQLKIPAKAAAPTTTGGLTSNPTTKPSGRSYTVRQGDTCADIAINQGVKASDLIAKNGLDANCQNLKIGQVLQIP
ncbi:MAG: LysM peptidoglycan-binding domain-containing protein [Tepidiformaceae bacterium]